MNNPKLIQLDANKIKLIKHPVIEEKTKKIDYMKYFDTRKKK